MTHFFIIFSPQGSVALSKQHETIEIAEEEAKRLACKHPGRDFIIMSSRFGYATSSTANIFFLEDIK
jgi:hypothetical protein